MKSLNNPQSRRVPVNELLVGAAGRLIGAPVCDVRPVDIPPELAGYEYRPGFFTEPGVTASGSRDVDGTVEERQFHRREEDDNRRHHAGVYALYDWCWGGDDQWLYCAEQANRLFSHDHGHYFPGGPDWTEASLTASVDEPHQLGIAATGVDVAALDELADELDRLDRGKIATVVNSIPPDWPVADDELEAVGWFLERRARPVAARLRQIKEVAAA